MGMKHRSSFGCDLFQEWMHGRIVP
jgi:hypothetical protein